MACPNSNNTVPQVSYAVASFGVNNYDNPARIISALRQLGVSVLTLVPTYMVKTEPMKVGFFSGTTRKRFQKPLSIDASQTPSPDKIKALAIAGIKAGMHIRLEPHLDIEAVFDSKVGEVYWRARLFIDPTASLPGTGTAASKGSYQDIVLKPLMAMLVSIKDTPVDNHPNCKACFSFTLGSELDMSLLWYAEKWKLCHAFLNTERISAGLQARLDFGHKVNHDYETRALHPRGWVGEINALEKFLQLGNGQYKPATRADKVDEYLKLLDYVGISFYPNMQATLTPKEWSSKPDFEKSKKLAKVFKQRFTENTSKRLGRLNKPLDISESGLGSANTGAPWSTKNSDQLKHASGKTIRKNYMSGLAEFMRKNKTQFKRPQRCLTLSPWTIWGAGPYDIAGLDPNQAELQDPELRKIIKEYSGLNSCPAKKKVQSPTRIRKTGYFRSERQAGQYAARAINAESRWEANDFMQSWDNGDATCGYKRLGEISLEDESIKIERSWLRRIVNPLRELFKFETLPEYSLEFSFRWVSEITTSANAGASVDANIDDNGNENGKLESPEED